MKTMCPSSVVGRFRCARVTVLLSLLMLLWIPRGVMAGDFAYYTNNGAITIWAYTGPGGTVIIPDTINGYPVTSIAAQAFHSSPQWHYITNMIISDNVNNIGSAAFFGATN